MEKDFAIEDIITVMKMTKKIDPLFKPLKKLKTAIEVHSIIIRVSDSKTYHFYLPIDFWSSISDSEISLTKKYCFRLNLKT